MLFIIIFIACILELFYAQLIFSVVIPEDEGLLTINSYKLFTSNKKLINIPSGYFEITPITLLGSTIVNTFESLYNRLLLFSKETFVTDLFLFANPIIDFINLPKYTVPTSNQYFYSTDPNLKIIMQTKNNKNYYYTKAY